MEILDIVLFIGVFFFIGMLIGGMIKTYKRNWVLALALMLLVFPLWVLWAFCELFTGQIQPKVVYIKQVD